MDLPPGPGRDLIDLLTRLAQLSSMNRTSIAQKAGLSPSYLSEIFTGRKTPTPETAAALATAMNASQAEQLAARRYAEQSQELRRHERATDPSPAAVFDRWPIYVAFALALDAAHNGLREVARDARDDASKAAKLAVHGSGLYAERERLLVSASPRLVAKAEVAFLALVELRNAVRAGARLSSEDYHRRYHPFAEALWLFRLAVRAELGQSPLTPQMLNREDWSDLDRCSVCGHRPVVG
jgi:transcriptional regulator with XRE-family HTH domain